MGLCCLLVVQGVQAPPLQALADIDVVRDEGLAAVTAQVAGQRLQGRAGQGEEERKQLQQSHRCCSEESHEHRRASELGLRVQGQAELGCAERRATLLLQ